MSALAHDPRGEAARALALLPACGFAPEAVEALRALCAAALAPAQDRRLAGWLDAAAALPAPRGAVEAAGAVRAGEAWGEEGAGAGEGARAEGLLRALCPWRKGPLWLGGTHIDTEWRSDWKWARVRPHVEGALRGARALDVGGGNGYYGWRMWGAGASAVVVVDPGRLPHAQFCAAQRALALALARRGAPPPPVGHLPLTLEALTGAGRGTFDMVFSMGVLYHRRDPAAHVAALRAHGRAGALVVLETLVWAREGDAELPLAGGRYANMGNVWSLPTPARALRWLAEGGLGGGRLVDLTPTTVEEQRRTAWMSSFSLAEALDPADAARTVEGHPAPVRALLLAEVP